MPKIQTNRTPEVLAKYEEVIRLRALGLSFQAIADRLGYSGRSGAREAYTQAVRLWGGEAVEELRIVENERLDYLLRTVVAQIEQTVRETEVSPGEISQLVNTAVNISKRRAALNGLDPARKHEISGLDGEAIKTDVGEMLRAKLSALEANSKTPQIENV